MSEDIDAHHERCWTYHQACLQRKIWEACDKGRTSGLVGEIDAELMARDDRILELERKLGGDHPGTWRSEVLGGRVSYATPYVFRRKQVEAIGIMPVGVCPEGGEKNR